MSNDESNAVVYQPTRNPTTGDWEVKAPLTSTTDTCDKEALLPGPWVIPIIFVPGIMGTNLKAKGSDSIAWRPPNKDGVGPMLDAIGQLLSYLFKGPAERQRELSTNLVEVDPRGSIEDGGSGLSTEVLRERGWGALMRSSYQPFMGLMQQRLNNIMENGHLKDWWAEHGMEAPSAWGDTKNNAALNMTQLKHAATYSYDVWGGGYNWLQSNRDSGADIGSLISNTIIPYYKKQKKSVKKVIVVTHSMGGLVARSLACIHQHPDVLGVIHGVQPATGAPATYKRMRAGFEAIEQVVLGRNAAEVTAVLCNAPGALELLPSADYNSGKPWLRVVNKKKVGGKDVVEDLMPPLPSAGDPYTDIYASSAWYGMVPAANEKLIDPAKMNPSKPGQSVRDRLRDKIDVLRIFHTDIKEKYHSETYAHFGAEPDKKRLAWGEVIWQGEGLAGVDARAFVVTDDDRNGKLELHDDKAVELTAPNVAGDGTVPYASGAAPGLAKVKASFEHGLRQPAAAPAAHNDALGYDHQDSYKDARSHFATLYGVIRCAQGADWHVC
jgi:pimeloyl-ACP methyl ester carboxylesterase